MRKIQIIREGVTCLFLWITAVPDLRTKRIPIGSVVLFAAVAAAMGIVCPAAEDGFPLWAGALPGAVLLLLSMVFRGQIGAGDGICLMACGFCTGLCEIVAILEGALILCAVYGFCRILRKRNSAAAFDEELAFIPFLAVSSGIRLLLLVCGGRHLN
jgi:leader peptidase (prepilin peptidase)/N-methyltransferase